LEVLSFFFETDRNKRPTLISIHLGYSILRRWLVRLGDEQAEAALLEPHVKPFDFTVKPMKRWAIIVGSGWPRAGRSGHEAGGGRK